MTLPDQLRQRHAEESMKLHAFVMGAAASGIAFALHETSDRPLAWSLAPALAAVVAWGLSFAAGIWSRVKVMQAVNSNRLYLEALAAQQMEGASTSKKYMAQHNTWAGRFQDAQLWLLLLGVLAYLGGHVWHLYELRSAPAKLDVQQTITAVKNPAEPSLRRTGSVQRSDNRRDPK